MIFKPAIQLPNFINEPRDDGETPRKYDAIGIVGGAGPMASVLFYETLITLCQEMYGAKKDGDFPEIMLLNYPFSPMCSITEAEFNSTRLQGELASCFQSLQDWGAKTVAIACNTLHNFIEDTDWSFTFKSIVCATLNGAHKAQANKLLFLGTEVSAKKQLYEKSAIDIIYPSPDAQVGVDKIISGMLAGESKVKNGQALAKIINKLQRRGLAFDGVILGCTELSLLYDQLEDLYKGMVFDSNRLLALEVLKASRGDV